MPGSFEARIPSRAPCVALCARLTPALSCPSDVYADFAPQFAVALAKAFAVTKAPATAWRWQELAVPPLQTIQALSTRVITLVLRVGSSVVKSGRQALGDRYLKPPFK
eukprot:1159500-Pelagomonas_calceolata.AAC.6